MNSKLKIFFSKVSEATPSCLLTMVQGNVAAITIDHWVKAIQVGAITGALAVGLSFFGNEELKNNKYVLAGLTGFLTAIADFVSHPSHFGGQSSEAIITGIGAGLLCLALSRVKSNAK